MRKITLLFIGFMAVAFPSFSEGPQQVEITNQVRAPNFIVDIRGTVFQVEVD